MFSIQAIKCFFGNHLPAVRTGNRDGANVELRHEFRQGGQEVLVYASMVHMSDVSYLHPCCNKHYNETFRSSGEEAYLLVPIEDWKKYPGPSYYFKPTYEEPLGMTELGKRFAGNN